MIIILTNTDFFVILCDVFYVFKNKILRRDP